MSFLTYVLVDRVPVQERDVVRWAKWLRTADVVVARTLAQPGVRVVTMFLGVDHNFTGFGEPLLFETVIETDDGQHRRYEEIRRWSTWQEAQRGHERAVSRSHRWSSKMSQPRFPLYPIEEETIDAQL